MAEGTDSWLTAYMSDLGGMRPQIVSGAGKAVSVFPKEETRKLQGLIAPYVHPSMQYKLLPRLRGLFGAEPQFVTPRSELMPLPVVAIAPNPPTPTTHRSDIHPP